MARLIEHRALELSIVLGPDPAAIARHLYAEDLIAEALCGIPALWDGESPIKATDFATWNGMHNFEDHAAGVEHLGVGAFVDRA